MSNREELIVWKDRALKAEQKLEHLDSMIPEAHKLADQILKNPDLGEDAPVVALVLTTLARMYMDIHVKYRQDHARFDWLEKQVFEYHEGTWDLLERFPDDPLQFKGATLRKGIDNAINSKGATLQ